MKKNIAAFIFIFSARLLSAQAIQVDDDPITKQVPFVSTIFNRVFNTQGLDSFYQKLFTLKQKGTGVINIVHIGDSHIQAGHMTGIARGSFQEFFGNAGRGLVFPYQLAQSNAPPDISSFSNTTWQYNRLAHPEISIKTGISGFGILSNSNGASINISIENNAFNKLKIFNDSTKAAAWLLHTDSVSTPFLIKANSGETKGVEEIKLDQYTTSFSLHALPSDERISFYGASLENSQPGVIYHAIGVNGATYETYNKSNLFWEQLPGLQADLVIVSLGTNEAQKPNYDINEFIIQFSNFLEKTKRANPGAAILVTTAPDSYLKKRRVNPVLKKINLALYEYCNKLNIPLWDLYRISNGMGSVYNWARRGLMNADMVHYTSQGYKIQGQLFFNAMARGYNNYISTH